MQEESFDPKFIRFNPESPMFNGHRIEEYDMTIAQIVNSQNYPFYALLAACFLGADMHNAQLLSRVFPHLLETTEFKFIHDY